MPGVTWVEWHSGSLKQTQADIGELMSTADGAPEDLARRATFREVLAIREFGALYVAYALSLAGDQLARIAVAVIVYDRTGSTFLTGLTYAVSFLPWLVGGPLLSGYADRLPRRSVMIACDLARGLVVLIIALAHLPDSVLICLVAVIALGEPPFDSARASLLPDIVGEEKYPTAVTLTAVTNQLAGVIGFAAGGILVVGLGAGNALVVDALTFLGSAAVTWRYVSFRPAANTTPGSILHELHAGLRLVFLDAKLRWLTVVTWIVLGVAVTTETVAIPYAAAHANGPITAGFLIASLPFGAILGTLVLGRLMSPQRSEDLMLPMALAAPALLAFTAFDPSPPIAAMLWLLTGIACAMTVTANRVFVLAVPREARGLAFGLAVTGIAASQGLYSVLTGLIALSVGPARAIADLALSSFALIVVFSVASASFRSRESRPIEEVEVAEREDAAMLDQRRRASAGVWALDIVLVIVTALAVPLLRGDSAFASANVPAAWVLLVFMACELYPLDFKARQHQFQIVIETVPLVIGLVYLPPLELIAIRVFAVGLVQAIVRGEPLVKLVYNTASIGVATFAATLAFEALAPTRIGPHPEAWPAIFAGVLAIEITSGVLLILVLLLAGAGSEIRRTVNVFAAQLMISIVMTFLGVITAAAVGYDSATIWAISVFVGLTIAGSQTYHRVSERAAALDRLYVVARELGPIANDPSDLAPALTQLRQVIQATSLELVATTGADHDFVSVVTVTEIGERDDLLTVEERPFEGPIADMLARSSTKHSWRKMLVPAMNARRQGDRASAVVRTAEREIGLLSAVHDADQSASFETSDLRLLEAAADQLAAALEKGRLIDSLRRAATLDTLTGLANLESLRSFLDTSLEGSAGGVLILVNIDRFREVNDMLGHEAGDAVLAEVARRLQSSPTHGALFARVGGDQFAIAIPGAAGSEVARLAGMAVKSRVDGSLRLAEVSADVRVSVGIARAPDHGSDAATLLRRAEMAMTAAKASSSGIGEWEPGYERDGSRRLQLLTGLRAALSDGSLRVEYQPKLQLGSGEVVGFEALVRWTHPELGPVSPVEFVPIAEATGLISALTSNVLRAALTTCRSWHDAGKPVGVAVNVSARSLDDDVLVGQVAAMLTASGLEPRWLTLEITESSVMEDHTRSLEVLRELRMLGVRLSIDDFGTGYSSLHQLRGLPVHEVKIDRSFVETVDSDDADRAVVHAVVELCDSLGLVTVAEGVEKASQAYALETLGVRQVQGYFHGRPMTELAAMEWIAQKRVSAFALN
jgi:diguanylate cyclase (GGDEF)-like protein